MDPLRIAQLTCPFCAKFTKSKSDMEKHIRTHTGTKPFSCTICQYSSNQSNNLNRHMRTKHQICKFVEKRK